MYNAKKAIKRMRRKTLMAQKYNKKLSNEILAQKRVNLSRNERQGNDAALPLLPNLVLYLDEERREVRSKVKRSEGEDLLVRLRLYHLLLIPRGLRVTKKTKKPRGFILYQMKINLNGFSRLERIFQTHSLRNTSQKGFYNAICEVHPVPNN